MYSLFYVLFFTKLWKWILYKFWRQGAVFPANVSQELSTSQLLQIFCCKFVTWKIHCAYAGFMNQALDIYCATWFWNHFMVAWMPISFAVFVHVCVYGKITSQGMHSWQRLQFRFEYPISSVQSAVKLNFLQAPCLCVCKVKPYTIFEWIHRLSLDSTSPRFPPS